MKPPYRVPLMSEIRHIPYNGRKVVELFAGGGGSDTGWRLAGFKVVWANEFIANAQESFRANHPDTILDGRDVKLVTAQEILSTTGLRVGELDVLSGSPPCKKFSMAGKRESGWAKNGGAGTIYDNGVHQNDEMMFFEYIRLLEGLQPRMFVAENVKGLTIGAAKEMMGNEQTTMFGGHKQSDDAPEWTSDEDTILHRLMDAGYVVRWRVLDAKNYGVPQTRNRVFFIGVRKDLACKYGVEPHFPKPLGYVYTVRDALPWIRGKVVAGDRGSQRAREEGKEFDADKPIASVIADGARNTNRGQFMVEERVGIAVIHDTTGRGEVGGQSNGKAHDFSKGDVTDESCPPITGASTTTHFKVVEERTAIGAVHDTCGTTFQRGGAGEISDKPAPALTYKTDQYLIVEEVRRELTVNPALAQEATSGRGGCHGHGQFDVENEVIITNRARGDEPPRPVDIDAPAPTVVSNRSRQDTQFEVRRDPATGASLELDASRLKLCDGTQQFDSAGGAATPNEPCPPVTTQSNSAVVQTERRKFTIAECRRICAFPDDYFLAGSYGKQWERLGNSVPPIFMMHIANSILEVLNQSDAVHAVEPEAKA